MKKIFQLVALVTVFALPGAAAEIAQLRNGFSIRHERHEAGGPLTRLYMSASGGSYIEVATDQIVAYEHEEGTQIAPAAPNNKAKAIKPISEHVSNASNSYGVDADFLNSVIRHESGFNPRAVSPKGARGLMQLMPQTASKLGVTDSFDPAANIDGGTRYLQSLLERYKGDAIKALAAYNAGPQRVDQYKGVPPYRETRAYVANIIRDYNHTKMARNHGVLPSAKTTAEASATPQ